MSLTPFDGLTPTRLLWVSAGAPPGGDGSNGSPFNTIQAAVDAATPGTAVMVKAGTYVENVQISRESSGTASAPVWIESADGPQMAKIVAPDPTLPAIGAGGVTDMIVQGFQVFGGLNGIQFSQDGTDYSKLVQNIVIQGNVVEGALDDGVKVDGAENVYVLGNLVKDGVTGQGVDFVAVNDSLVAQNEITAIEGSSGIFAKGGSTNDVFADNYIHDLVGDGIGMGNHMGDLPFRPGYSGYEVMNLEVVGNRVENVGGRAIAAVGAVNSEAFDNYLTNTADAHLLSVNADTLVNGQVLYSSNLSFVDNIFDSDRRLLEFTPGNGRGLVFLHNYYHGASTVGGPLADVITGGKGADLIWGGAGADTLTGGAGKDTFIYAPGDGGDQITDFKPGLDRLDLRPISAMYADLTVATKDSAMGLLVFANYDGQSELLATLDGVHAALRPGTDYIL